MTSEPPKIRAEIDKLILQYNSRRVGYLNRRRISKSAENWILFALLIGTLSASFAALKMSEGNTIPTLIIVAGIFIGGVMKVIITGEDERAENAEQKALLQSLLPRVFHEFDEFKYDPHPYQRLKLPPFLTKRWDKQIRGQKVSCSAADTFFTLHEIELIDTLTEESRVQFKGVLLAFNLIKFREGKTVIKQNKRLFQAMPALTGPEEPDLPHHLTGDPEFDQQFEIHGSNDKLIKRAFSTKGRKSFVQALEPFDPDEFAMELDNQVVTMMLQTHLPIFRLHDIKNEMNSDTDIQMLREQLGTYQKLIAELQKVFAA